MRQRIIGRQCLLKAALDLGGQRRRVTGDDCIEHPPHKITIDIAEHLAHLQLFNFAVTKRYGLISDRQRVAHRALRGLTNQAQRRRVERHVLGGEYFVQLLGDALRRKLLECELQATRQHGDWDFLGVGGGEHELDVFRRLFERLQHRVERAF